jgi:hypothetical protein
LPQKRGGFIRSPSNQSKSLIFPMVSRKELLI